MVYVIQKMLLETDAAKARAVGRAMFSFYTRLPNYANSIRTLGFSDEDLANGVSDRLVDALLAWGTEQKLHDALDAQFKAGADHICHSATGGRRHRQGRSPDRRAHL